MSELPDLLSAHRATLVRFFERKGAYLKRYEAAEDLAQGVHLHALRYADRFEYQGDPQFVSWLLQLARQHLANRIAHWKALKRDAGPMMRITFSGTGVQPAADAIGPSTHASQKEQLNTAALAMDGLPPRDRELVKLMSAGASIADIAAQMDMTETATQRARLRAIDRFRKIYEIVERKRR